MLGKSRKLGVPRRVVVYYLLFSLGAVFWLTLSAFVASHSILGARLEKEMLGYLGAASSTVNLDYLRHGGQNFQALVERFQRQRSLFYCLIVDPDGRILAHTQRGRVGEKYESPSGDYSDWGDYQAVRFSSGSGPAVCEYVAPLRVRGDPIGTLRVAVQEPGFWTAAQLSAFHTPLMLVVPILFVVLGTFALYRMVWPLAVVESQLRALAVAPTVDEVQLDRVEAATASALGWNRLLEQFRTTQRCGELDQRLSDAVQLLRQEKFDDVLNSLADGIAVTDREGRITFANHATAGLFTEDGQPDSLIGQTVVEVLGLDEQQRRDGKLLRAELAGRHVVEEIGRIRGAVQQLLRIARSPIRAADQSISGGHVWSLRDVTQQRMAEQSRNEFLDSATHELRTPLANIRAYAETLALNEMLDVENQKEFCNTINAEATRLARFIDDLLSISSMEVGSLAVDRQEVALDRLFQEVLGKVKPQMDQKRIKLETVFPEKYPHMKLDKDKIIVALVNLLGNAAKYTPEEGHVAFKVRRTESEMLIDVQDTGVGISKEELPQVFDKFFRSANPSVKEQTGTGLGLSMAQEVIRLHGGDLSVKSELGKGSTFTATLPLN